MNEPMHSDLVAIGGGFAGICAAVRGAELGLRTAVREASTTRGIFAARAGRRDFHEIRARSLVSSTSAPE
jgi:succinate dehydrogenase/fumarate reductase flavoprotein subunit